MNTEFLRALPAMFWSVSLVCMMRYMYLHWTGRVSRSTTWSQLSQGDFRIIVIGLVCLALGLACTVTLLVLR